jgi:DNA-binding MarR family transcriptional regulator
MDEMRAGWLLREVARIHSQLQRNEVAICCDTPSTQCHILTELDRSGPLTFAELVRRLNTDKGWVSRTVESMTQEGLLTKAPKPTDKRTIIVTLTESGGAKAVEVQSTLNSQSGRVLQRIPAAERGNVARALELLHRALQSENAGEPILIELEDDLS